MSKLVLFRNIVRVMKSKEMGVIYSTHETYKKCIQNLKGIYTLGELDADRKIILKITEEAVYKNQIQMAPEECNSSYEI